MTVSGWVDEVGPNIDTSNTLIIMKVNGRYLYTTLLPAGISPISRGRWMTKLCRIMWEIQFLQETSLICDGGGVGVEGTIKMMTAPWYFVSFSSELVTFLWPLLAVYNWPLIRLIGKYSIFPKFCELFRIWHEDVPSADYH